MTKKQIKKFKIQRHDFTGGHSYEIDGEKIPTVTTIIKAVPKAEPLIRWIADRGWDKSQEEMMRKAAIGTKVHEAIEALLNGKTVFLENYSKDQIRMLQGFERWYYEYKPTEILAEKVVGSAKYKFAGTVDKICLIGDDYWAVDFKTTSGIYNTYGLQLSAYKHAINEMGLTPKPVTRIGVLRLTTGTKGWEFKEFDDQFDIFLKVYEVWKWLNPDFGKEEEELKKLPKSIKLKDIKL